jgi:hypothetical protein
MQKSNVPYLPSMKLIPQNRARRFTLQALALLTLLTIVAKPVFAQTGQWQAVVLSATSAGWVETRGTATISQDFSQIYLKDNTGISREVYRGELKNPVWVGTRSVINTETLGEQVSGRYSMRTIDRYQVETLVLTNGTTSANFIRSQLIR